MADISRNTTPAWQDPHLKDRGDYTEQDIQNIREKGGILPDFTLDEAEETHLVFRQVGVSCLVMYFFRV
ncbi:hypothetical protein [Bifidobacterium longum]|uniref:hypothetical protein n=1 Tax=Bifidobacterium longum TaxID=216816 RepID=UPI00374ED23A